MEIDDFESRGSDFWRGMLNLVCGKGHGLGVAVYGTPGDERIEILGSLPLELKRGLRQAVLSSTALRRKSKRVGRGEFTWVPRREGYGRAYFVPDQNALIGLLLARRALMAKKAA